ncbi:MAG: hypothetical protein OEL91_09355, partial [Burkholderiaceae bacterium]|nr:hypothetical protein [Burkholderiaceae bacterium]
MTVDDIQRTVEKNIEATQNGVSLSLKRLLKDTPLGKDVATTLIDFLQLEDIALANATPTRGKGSLTIAMAPALGPDAVLTLTFTDVSEGVRISALMMSDNGLSRRKLSASVLSLAPKTPLQLPAGIDLWDKFCVEQLALTFDTKVKTLTHAEIRVSTRSPWTLPGLTDLGLTAGAMHLVVATPRDAVQRKVSGNVQSLWAADGALVVDLAADLQDKVFTLSGSGTTDVGKLAARFNAELPDRVKPAVGIVDVQVVPSERTFSLTSSADVNFYFGQQSLNAVLNLRLDGNSSRRLSGSIHVRKKEKTSPLVIAEGLHLTGLDLRFILEHENGRPHWRPQGALGLSVADTELNVRLNLHEKGKLKIDGKAVGKPIALPGGLGSVSDVVFDMTLGDHGPPTGTLTAALSVGMVDLKVKGQIDEGRLRFAIDVPKGKAKLSDILSSMAVSVPPQLPHIESEGDFHVEYLPPSGKHPAEFAVKGKTTAAWDFQGKSLPTLISFDFRRKVIASNPDNHHDTGHLEIKVAQGGVNASVTDFMVITDVG